MFSFAVVVVVLSVWYVRMFVNRRPASAAAVTE